MDNKVAPPGAVFVCIACGKRSRDLFGDRKIDRGWDVSCILNSLLCRESSLVMSGGRVTSADPWEEDEKIETQSPPGDDVTQAPSPQG